MAAEKIHAVSPQVAPPPRYAVTEHVRISALSFELALGLIDGWVERRERHYVNVCTAHTILECHDAPALAAVVNGSGMATPDGMPLVWLGRLRGHPVERVYGPDLMLAVCERGLARGYRHFLYGGTPEVVEELARRLQARFPGLQIAGTYAPPFRPLSGDEERATVALINDSAPDIVWVGLGTPKQDYWVARFRPWLAAPALIAIGAAFDFHAGRVRQAPPWLQRAGLEWLFRLSQEPRRLWRRYLLGNPRFVALALRQLIRERLAG